MLSPDDRLFFIHIPKTAGTTLIPLIDMHFHEREICPAQLWRELVRLPQQEIPKYRLFRGHFGGDGLSTFLPSPPVYMTMLRQPVPLALSTYKFIRREPGTRVHKLVHDEQMDLAAFLDHQETRGKISNKQTRHLSFCLEHDPDTGPIFLHEESLAVVDGWVKRHRTRVAPDERLDRAKEKLRSCAFFGLVERFEESMALLCYTFGWPPVGSVQKLMVAPEDRTGTAAALDDSIRQRLIELNQLDVELYEFAQRLFDERLSAMKKELEPSAPMEGPPASGSPLHDLLDRHYLAMREQCGEKAKASIRIDLDEPLFGDGWHRREPSSLDGTTFRWTGPGTLSSMDVNVCANEDFRITIRLINALLQDIYDSFQLRVNGEGIPLKLIDGRAGVRVLQGTVSRQALGRGPRGFTRLEFAVDRTISPREIDSANPDTRQVGVALNWIDLAPAGALAAGEVPRVEVKPEQRQALRERRRTAIMTRLKQRVASIPVVGPRLRTAYIRFKSR